MIACNTVARWLWAVVVVGAFAWLASSSAQADPVESGKGALGKLGSNWYDSPSDGLRRINPPPLKEPPQQSSQPGRSGGGDVGSTAMMLVWIMLGIALAALCGMLIKFFLQGEVEPIAANGTRKVADRARIEALPFDLSSLDGDLLAEARRRYEAGEYSAAMVYLYSHQLIELDRNHVIRLARGKTNRQYLREASRRSGLRTLLEPAMIAFEDAFFGHRQLDRTRFEARWSQLDEFQRLAAQQVAT